MDLSREWTLEDELKRWQEELQDAKFFEDGENKIQFCKDMIEDIKKEIRKRGKESEEG